MENNSSKVVCAGGSGTALGTLVWIVFMILGYGFGSQPQAVGFPLFLYQNQFWIWFPLWIGPAVLVGLILLILIISWIVLLVTHIKDIKAEKKRAKQQEYETLKREEERKAKELADLKKEEYIKNNYAFDLRLPVGVSRENYSHLFSTWVFYVLVVCLILMLIYM